MAYATVEPFGPRAEDMRFGHAVGTLINWLLNLPGPARLRATDIYAEPDFSTFGDPEPEGPKKLPALNMALNLLVTAGLATREANENSRA